MFGKFLCHRYISEQKRQMKKEDVCHLNVEVEVFGVPFDSFIVVEGDSFV